MVLKQLGGLEGKITEVFSLKGPPCPFLLTASSVSLELVKTG